MKLHQFDDTSQRTSHHEAGHTVIAMALGIPVIGVVMPSDSLGHTYLDGPLLKMLSPTERLLIAAAGLAAESAWCQLAGTTYSSYSIGHVNDEKEAASDLQALGHEGKFLCYVALAGRVLSERWEQVAATAKLLLSQRSLSPEQIARIGTSVRKMEDFELSEVTLIASLMPAPSWQ